VVCPPGDQEKVNGPIPPLGFTVIAPSQSAQFASVTAAFAAIKVASVIVTVAVAVQLFTSLTVTVYDPAHNPFIDAVVCPPGAQE